MWGRMTLAALLAGFAAGAAADPQVVVAPDKLGSAVQPYILHQEPRLALRHVRVIDGTGAPAEEDRTVIVERGKIAAIEPGGAKLPSGVTELDLTGHTVLPGIVGMHDHLFYIAVPNRDAENHRESPLVVPEMPFSSPRLYLANGVTTLRTTGSIEPYSDLNLKAAIDAGTLPGPHLDVTAPYLEGAESFFIQMPHLKDAEDARRTVAFWADHGATSFKAYMNITRDELAAAIETAHRYKLKVTGHLCSVTYPEAVAAGIDNLEHGFFVNTQLDSGKIADRCSTSMGEETLKAMTPDSAAASSLIRLLIDHHVAVTSTLPVFEQDHPADAPLSAKVMSVLTPEARESYLYSRNRLATDKPEKQAARKAAYDNDVALEKKFFDEGGLLLAGPDPTGNGGVVPGFGDLREIELLVAGGFTPEQAIKVATLNGAVYLGLDDRIGSLRVGRDADIVVVKGDPSKSIKDIEEVEMVFKDGVGFDSRKLIDSVRGRFGQY